MDDHRHRGATTRSGLRARSAAGLMLAGQAFAAWMAVILFLQAYGWMDRGIWQPVPTSALFLSPDAKTRHLRVFERSINALDAVPSLAGHESTEHWLAAMPHVEPDFEPYARRLGDAPLSLQFGLLALVLGGAAVALQRHDMIPGHDD